MTAWLVRLMPQYVGARFDVYAWWFLGSLTWAAVLSFATKNMELAASSQAAFGIAATSLGALGAIDLAVHRLPRQISYASLSLVAALFVIGSASQSTDVVGGVVLMFVMVGTLRIVSRGSLGKGDLHLAPLLGALIGWFDPYRVLLACVVMAVSAAVVAGGFLATRHRRGSDYIAYGPFMLFGTAVAIVGARG